jgi:protein-S-isoprenylcysteine O-methyltransferase Ste14
MILTYLAAGFFAMLAGIRLGPVMRGDYFALVLSAHAGIAAYLLIVRSPQQRGVSPIRTGAAWTSAMLPLSMVTSGEEHPTLSILSTTGVAFAVWALWCLGRSFGVAPADRGVVQRGPYRWVRHPMYLGELFSFVMIVIGSSSCWNIVVLTITVMTIFMRIRWEEKLIVGYGNYAQSVRWRLVPYLW